LDEKCLLWKLREPDKEYGQENMGREGDFVQGNEWFKNQVMLCIVIN